MTVGAVLRWLALLLAAASANFWMGESVSPFVAGLGVLTCLMVLGSFALECLSGDGGAS